MDKWILSSRIKGCVSQCLCKSHGWVCGQCDFRLWGSVVYGGPGLGLDNKPTTCMSCLMKSMKCDEIMRYFLNEMTT